MVVIEYEESTLCSFIQRFLAKASNFMAPSGIRVFFARAQLSLKKGFACLFHLGFNYWFLFYHEGLAPLYQSECVEVFWRGSLTWIFISIPCWFILLTKSALVFYPKLYLSIPFNLRKTPLLAYNKGPQTDMYLSWNQREFLFIAFGENIIIKKDISYLLVCVLFYFMGVINLVFQLRFQCRSWVRNKIQRWFNTVLQGRK